MSEFPTQLIVPLGAVLAASITGAISFVNLVVSKEQKTSEFRQAWIDAFRLELAEFCSHARRISVESSPINLKSLSGSVIDTIDAHNEEILRADPLHENRQRLAHTYYSLRLRLNPSEKDHDVVLQHLDNVYEVLNSSSDSTCYDKTVAELDAIARISQVVLKREWTRVKEGESAFRRAIALAKWFAAIPGAIVIAIIAYALYVAVVAI